MPSKNRSMDYFRQYDPVLGRFLQSDPIGLKGGMNTFLYALANALRWVDRFGLDCDVDAALNAERQRSEAALKEIEARTGMEWTMRSRTKRGTYASICGRVAKLARIRYRRRRCRSLRLPIREQLCHSPIRVPLLR